MPEIKQQRKMPELDNKLGKSSSDFEAKQNLLGFFNLLLKIDRRNNPHLYQKSYEDNRDTNHTN